MMAPPKLPEAGYGTCLACGTKGDLGAGLCVKCWDEPAARRAEKHRIMQRDIQVRALWRDGFSVRDIASAYSLSMRVVYRILQGG